MIRFSRFCFQTRHLLNFFIMFCSFRQGMGTESARELGRRLQILETFLAAPILETYLKKLVTLQSKAVKIVGNGTWNDRATPYYAKLKILILQDLVKLGTAAFVYNYKSGQLPSTFRNYFTALNNIHVKPTRAISSHNFFVPFFKTLKLYRSIKYQGPKIWNSFDLEIKKSKPLKTFKSRLKN